MKRCVLKNVVLGVYSFIPSRSIQEETVTGIEAPPVLEITDVYPWFEMITTPVQKSWQEGTHYQYYE